MIRRRFVNWVEWSAEERYSFLSRPGVARYGKKMVLRRERREGMQEIMDQLEDRPLECKWCSVDLM